MSHGVPATATPVRVDGDLARHVAQTMQALATPSRVLILSELRRGPRSVGELAAAVKMEASAVSHQLRLLRHLGLVAGRRAGRRVHYELHDSHVAVLLDEAVGHVEHLRLVGDGAREPAAFVAGPRTSAPIP